MFRNAAAYARYLFYVLCYSRLHNKRGREALTKYMSVVLLVIALVLGAVAFWLLWAREVVAPVAAFLGLVTLFFSDLLPLNVNIIITWLALTLVTVGVSVMQPPAVMSQRRGVGYMTVGALAGMVLGLPGMTMIVDSLNAVYALMVVGVIIGVFLGYFLYTRTPRGRQLRATRSRFVSYMLAKGAPVAIVVMQLGVVLILWLAKAVLINL